MQSNRKILNAIGHYVIPKKNVILAQLCYQTSNPGIITKTAGGCVTITLLYIRKIRVVNDTASKKYTPLKSSSFSFSSQEQ